MLLNHLVLFYYLKIILLICLFILNKCIFFFIFQNLAFLDLLRLSLGEYVYIKLRGEREIRGKLHVCSDLLFFYIFFIFLMKSYDQHLNLLVSDANETIKTVEIDEVTGEETMNVC